MKVISTLCALFLLTGFISVNKDINPIGTYKLESKTREKNGEIYGYFGEIRVAKLNAEKIIMSFEVCKGAPSYNSGSFIDTLNYKNNKAIYADPENDQSCEITFEFTEKGIFVIEKTDDLNSGCGFGHAVVADGFYKKISRKIPKIAFEE
jgi:hypothetical protein